MTKAYFEEGRGNLEETQKHIEKLLEINPYNLNRGVIQEILKRTGITIDAKYYEQLAEDKEEKYAISLDNDF